MEWMFIWTTLGYMALLNITKGEDDAVGEFLRFIPILCPIVACIGFEAGDLELALACLGPVLATIIYSTLPASARK